MTIPRGKPTRSKAASRSSDLTQRAGDLIGKGALVATHAALTLARGAVAGADTAVTKYLPAGTSSLARVARKAKKARAKVKRKVRKAAGKAKRTAKSAVKSPKQRMPRQGRR